MKRVLALHLAGNAFLLWFGYYWLGIGESSIPRFLWSLTVGLAFAALTLWLHSGTLVFFQESLGAARRSACHLPWIFTLAVLAISLYFGVGWLRELLRKPSVEWASWLTFHLRRPVAPATTARVVSAVFWAIRWMLLPALLLPVAADLARSGRTIPRGRFPLLRDWRYWLEVPVLLVIAIDLPFRLIGWVPQVNGFALEMVSFTLRMLVGYLLFVGAWLLLLFVTATGRTKIHAATRS